MMWHSFLQVGQLCHTLFPQIAQWLRLLHSLVANCCIQQLVMFVPQRGNTISYFPAP
jgi:hypothetical protein